MTYLSDLKLKLDEFGKKSGFIPYTKLYSDLRDDFGYVDPEIENIAYQAKSEIEDLYAQQEGVVPFHWHKVRVNTAKLPSELIWQSKEGNKIVKQVRGILGKYQYGGGGLLGRLFGIGKNHDIFINKDLSFVNDGGRQLKTTLKHELIHSIQDELGTIYNEPLWKTEGEASLFSEEGLDVLDPENHDMHPQYKNWTLQYIKNYGKKLSSSFKKRMKWLYYHFWPWEQWAIKGSWL
jgi:hypothetical protein